MKIINKDVREAIQRLRLYLRQIEYDLAAGDRHQMLSDLAELGEIANRTWHLISSGEQ
jgi:hypothetical protein